MPRIQMALKAEIKMLNYYILQSSLEKQVQYMPVTKSTAGQLIG